MRAHQGCKITVWAQRFPKSSANLFLVAMVMWSRPGLELSFHRSTPWQREGLWEQLASGNLGLQWRRGDTAAKNVWVHERNWRSEKESDLEGPYIHYCVCVDLCVCAWIKENKRLRYLIASLLSFIQESNFLIKCGPGLALFSNCYSHP